MVVWEALDALSHEFELCGLDPTTRVVVLFDPDTDHERVALVRTALARSGSDAVEARSVRDRRAEASGDETTLIGALLGAADVVIDCRSGSDAATGAVSSTGPSWLRLGAGSLRPQDFPPHATLVRRVEALGLRLGESQRLVLHDDNGTALGVRLGGAAIELDHGVLGDETAAATFPAGWVRVTPQATAVDGDLVIMPGDALPAGRRLVSSPVRLRIVDDRINEIHGDSADADVFRALLEAAGDPNGYAFASISLGMNPGVESLEAFDLRLLEPDIARLLAGIVTVGFGENLVADRPCRQRITVALRHRNLALDELPIVHEGLLQGDFAPDVYETGR